jgi:hypothetical protein
MTNHDRAPNPEACEGVCQNGSLSLCGPEAVAWALTVPIARPVKGQHPVSLSDQAEHATRNIVFRLDSIPMQQHDRRATHPGFEIVQSNAACVDEPPGWRMLPLSSASIGANLEGNAGQGCGCRGKAHHHT